MKRAVRIASIMALGVFGLGLGGCKAGKGERCQVMADCADGLVCNVATNTCQSTTGGGIDATVPDGPKVDAGTDAPTDAAHDAATD